MLIELNIPHNLFMTYGKPLNGTCETNSLRIIIYPRKDNYGCKLSLSFNLAFCELSGYIPVGSKLTLNILNLLQVFEMLMKTNIN